MVWDPKQYLRFSDERQRPAADLLRRIDLAAPARIVDLGCGPGTITRLLRERWPQAAILGVDSSPEMLAQAVEAAPGVEWRKADIATFPLSPAFDLVYSNAALHLLGDHAQLFPRLAQSVSPGGVLAVQMPLNHAMPSHTGMAAAAMEGSWVERLAPLLRRHPVAEAGVYYDLLRPYLLRLDIWETSYLQVMEGPDPVVEWTRGTALKPLLDALEGAEREAFLTDYSRRMREAYPARPDGRTLFPFRRLFLVGVRG